MLIDQNGTSLGIMETKKAQDKAYEAELDLVCVAPQANPPVCKILNYSKFRYEKEKKEKEATKNQKTVDIKEIQLSPTIAQHDFDTKLTQGRKFLMHGDKVKVTLFIKRRYITLQDKAMEIVQDYVSKCADISQSGKKPDFDGKVISVVISPLTKAQLEKKAKAAKSSEEANEASTESPDNQNKGE